MINYQELSFCQFPKTIWSPRSTPLLDGTIMLIHLLSSFVSFPARMLATELMSLLLFLKEVMKFCKLLQLILGICIVQPFPDIPC